jgi:hypothetical protein
MANTQDYTKAFTDMMNAFPVDASLFNDAFRNTAEFGERMSKIALQAAERSNDVSNRWTRETLSRLNDVTRVKEEPSEYGKALTDFASASAETASESMAAYAEIAKKVQMDTVEALMSAGKTATRDATAAAQQQANTAANVSASAAPQKPGK